MKLRAVKSFSVQKERERKKEAQRRTCAARIVRSARTAHVRMRAKSRCNIVVRVALRERALRLLSCKRAKENAGRA